MKFKYGQIVIVNIPRGFYDGASGTVVEIHRDYGHGASMDDVRYSVKLQHSINIFDEAELDSAAKRPSAKPPGDSQ